MARFLSRERDGSCIKAATDDIVIFLKAHPDREAELHAKITKVLEIVNEGARKVGLTFANDKAQVLMPKDWVPTGGVSLPAGLTVRSNTFADSSLRGWKW